MHTNHRRKNYQRYRFSWRSGHSIRQMLHQKFRAKVRQSLLRHPEGDLIPIDRELRREFAILFW
jgi:hypothetical protein